MDGFPVGDWQFWIATAVFAAAVMWLTRGLVPWARMFRRGGKLRGHRATLTVEGVAPAKKKCH